MSLLERFFGQKPQSAEETPPVVVDRGEAIMDRWNKNIAQAAQRMSENGLQVDLDDLGWEAARAYASFLDQDPEKLRWLAVKGLEFGMFDEEESQEMLADADYVEEEQKRLQRSI